LDGPALALPSVCTPLSAAEADEGIVARTQSGNAYAPGADAATAAAIATVCVPEKSLPALLSWAALHQLPVLVCFTAGQAVQMVQTKSVGLIAIGQPPDALFSDTVRALRGIRAQTRFLYVAADSSDLRCLSGPPPGTDHVLVEPFTEPQTSEILERSWVDACHADETLIAGPVRLELGSRTLTVDGTIVALPGKRFELVAYLMRNSSRDIPKAEIGIAVFKTVRGDPKRVAKEVHAVRVALGRAARMIQRCPGGYRFNPSADLPAP
jgi:DNA-binding response OmpR family regulator